jgi:CRP-like cAMP-binding protein
MANASRNHLLASLLEADFGLLAPYLESVMLPVRKQIERPNKPIDAVYFPESGFASVVAVQSGGKEVEVGLIGREGMTGLPILHGDHQTPHSTYMQASGAGRCIPSESLRKAIRASRSLHDMLLKYAQAFGIQTTHTAISNAHSKLDRRLARWLLMAHDRLGVDVLPLTQEFLSLMLGVRRAGVTDTLAALTKQGMITHARGNITVKDRKGLERHAGDSYGVPESEYRRLLG